MAGGENITACSLTLSDREARELREFLENVDFDEVELPSLNGVKYRLDLAYSIEEARAITS